MDAAIKTKDDNGDCTLIIDTKRAPFPTANNKYYKHDTIVNLYNDIKIYDQVAASQADQVDDCLEMEVKDDLLKDTSSNHRVFRRPVLLIAILIIAVAIFILCPFLQLATESHKESSSEDNDTWITERREAGLTGNFVQIDNLWDGQPL
ncbi:hypothetical protein SNE40_020203 [Patella caerulea]|uniref:Uncharacterized protein n=1 Tax=Patella caerulea TaxID=87958 RepID=A0AAN8IZG1_PATCE